MLAHLRQLQRHDHTLIRTGGGRMLGGANQLEYRTYNFSFTRACKTVKRNVVSIRRAGPLRALHPNSEAGLGRLTLLYTGYRQVIRSAHE